LVKISLTPEESDSLQKDVSSIVGYISKLQELKLADELITDDSAVDLVGLRSDWVIGIPIAEAKNLIKQAPRSEDNLISTKPIFNRAPRGTSG